MVLLEHQVLLEQMAVQVPQVLQEQVVQMALQELVVSQALQEQVDLQVFRA